MKNQEEGRCPKCNKFTLFYGVSQIEDDNICYPYILANLMIIMMLNFGEDFKEWFDEFSLSKREHSLRETYNAVIKLPRDSNTKLICSLDEVILTQKLLSGSNTKS